MGFCHYASSASYANVEKSNKQKHLLILGSDVTTNLKRQKLVTIGKHFASVFVKETENANRPLVKKGDS